MQMTAPRRVETSLLVLEQFRDSDGTEWRQGERAPRARRAVREAVSARPELLGIEHKTLPWSSRVSAGAFGCRAGRSVGR